MAPFSFLSRALDFGHQISYIATIECLILASNLGCSTIAARIRGNSHEIPEECLRVLLQVTSAAMKPTLFATNLAIAASDPQSRRRISAAGEVSCRRCRNPSSKHHQITFLPTWFSGQRV